MKHLKKSFIGLLVIFVILLAFTACGDKDDGDTTTYEVPQPKTITQSDGLAFEGKVKISTSDEYPDDGKAWDAVVSKVIAALNRGYNKDFVNPMAAAANKLNFESIFGNSENAEVIVLVSTSHNIEVKSGEYNKLYLKESSLDTVDTSPAVNVMQSADGSSHQAKAKQQAKDGVFFLLWDKTFIVNMG